MRRDNDIKAPDGYTVGGLRLVRKDGTILFNRGWWQAPKEWAGEKVWVHEEWKWVSGQGETLVLEVAQPGLHIYEAKIMRPEPFTIICDRTERPDARPANRLKWKKVWANRTDPEPRDDSNDWYSHAQLEEIARQPVRPIRSEL